MKKNIFTLALKIGIISTLTSSCQGLNDNKIDPVLLAHAKAVIDFDSLRYNPYLQVYQNDCKTAWLYTLSSRDGSIWHTTGKTIMGKIFDFPTDMIEYKGKYILFYLRNKKPLNGKLLAKALNLKLDEDGYPITPNPPHMDTRIWYYFKDKHSARSLYTRSDTENSSYDAFEEIPELRYFLCNGEDSAAYYSHIVDMQIWGSPHVYGKENKKEKFGSPNQIKFWMRISNNTDSALYISTLPEKYGHFVVRNGKNPLPCCVINTTNANEVSPGLYEILPHTKTGLLLSTEKQPIVFQNTSLKKYPDKIYQLVNDSIYYLPTNTPPENEKRYIWNKKFKIHFPFLYFVDYYIDDMRYTFYWDGDIDEEGWKEYEKTF